jgi:hypothetical protein
MGLSSAFCDSYQEHPDLSDFIAGTKEDPDSKYWPDFYSRYRRWERDGASEDWTQVQLHFRGPTIPKAALEAGAGKPEGRVRKKHCAVFVDYVNKVGTAEQQLASILTGADVLPAPAIEEKDPDRKLFEMALRAYFSGVQLTDEQKGLLNGACFMRRVVKETGLPGGNNKTPTLTEYIVIPGYVALENKIRNPNDPLWVGVFEKLDAAIEALDTPLINLDLVVQLRMFPEKPNFPSQVVGTGIGILGAG